MSAEARRRLLPGMCKVDRHAPGGRGVAVGRIEQGPDELMIEAKRDTENPAHGAQRLDGGLAGLTLIANYYRIAADPEQLRHQLALTGRLAEAEDIVRAANLLQMKSRIIRGVNARRIGAIPYPAIIQLKAGGFAVLAVASDKGRVRLVDPLARTANEVTLAQAEELTSGLAILVGRRLGGAGVDPETFGFRWFWPSIVRYRKPLAHVLVASLFVQLFGLATPIFFQLVVDKVLVHKGMSTLVVLVVGMVTLGLFETVLQFLRTYTLSHTTNRIDVELGRRLFHHLFRLPLAYFETRPAGQTVARMRELETIRGFLTGQGLTSLLDLVFTLVFIAVMFIYSVKLTLVVLVSIPVYVVIATAIRPVLREQIKERFNRGARSQQFLVESIVGAQTLKAASVEPMMQAQWEERLAAYVRTSFDAGVTGAIGQNLIQYVSKITTALILFVGAQSVIEGSMSVGELIAFNMIASQVVQPILRLSQLWQDFQQVQVSVARLGDILNSPPEPVPQNLLTLPPPRGAIEFRHVTMRYRPDASDVLRNVSLSIEPGRSDRHRRAVRVGQVDADQAHPAPLQSAERPGDDRRRRRRPARSRLAAPADRRRAAGEHPVQPHDPREHRARRSGDGAGDGDAGGEARRRRRVHRAAAARLRHDDRGARGQPFRRPAPAHRHRPRARHQPAHPDPRRGDLRPRLRERAHHPGEHARDRARPHRHHHRAPAGGRPPVHADLRHGAGRDRRDPARTRS